MSRKKGEEAEHAACAYLQKQGLVLLQQNYHCRWGEIDLIMRDTTFLVFVEVRARKSLHFGGALESITSSKQNKLWRSAMAYQVAHKLVDKLPARFDIVIFQGVAQKIEWIKNAFSADY